MYSVGRGTAPGRRESRHTFTQRVALAVFNHQRFSHAHGFTIELKDPVAVFIFDPEIIPVGNHILLHLESDIVLFFLVSHSNTSFVNISTISPPSALDLEFLQR